MGVSALLLTRRYSYTYVKARTRRPNATFNSTDGRHFHGSAAGHCVPVRIPRHFALKFSRKTLQQTKSPSSFGYRTNQHYSSDTRAGSWTVSLRVISDVRIYTFSVRQSTDPRLRLVAVSSTSAASNIITISFISTNSANMKKLHKLHINKPNQFINTNKRKQYYSKNCKVKLPVIVF